MQVFHRKFPYSRSDAVFKLYHLTDLHIGAAACDEKLLRADIQRIAEDPHALWTGGGDYIDAIPRKNDKRYSEENLARWLHGKGDVLGHQAAYFDDMFAPIATKCVGLGIGNHEWAALKYNDRDIYVDIVQRVARRAGVEPQELALGVHGFYILHFRREAKNTTGNGWPLVIYTHHGYGGGSLPGGHALALGRILNRYECDLALIGHRHVGQHVTQVVTRPMKNRAEDRTRIGAFVPSYLGARIQPSLGRSRPTDTYSEEHGLGATPLGTTPVLIEPFERNFHLVVSHGTGGNLVSRMGR